MKTTWGSVTAPIPGTETRDAPLPVLANWKSGKLVTGD
jgi:hypothetical protein